MIIKEELIMAINAEIITSNPKLVDGKIVGGFHATIIAKMLSSTEHLIATIDSVIKNNLLYECKDGIVLDEVVIGCNDHDAVDYIIEHRDDLFSYTDAKIRICVDACCF